MKEYSFEIAGAIKAFLDEDDWHYDFDEEKGKFRFNLTIKEQPKKVEYTILVHEDSFYVDCKSQLHADSEDAEVMAKLAEFFTRANYGLRDGNFQMDFNDGEMGYKVYRPCDDGAPVKETIKSSIYVAAAMWKRYGPGMMSVSFSGADPKDAVDKCEGNN